ncbi:threonine aldolase family protein [Methylopila henanensis]|uniref:L-threonine aldolase n=1 Tax=Methylopila henanensis TaxID=873516 RepID=A0ABW4K9I2_9HYPH
MYLASDNAAPAAEEVLQALARANAGASAPYGRDEPTRRVEAMFSELFGREVGVFLVTTGTAANALALAQITPPWGAAIGHAEAHVMHDECGAPEFFTAGAKIVGVPGLDGRMTADGLKALLARDFWTPPTHVAPAAVTISQATEAGTLYRPAEISAIADVAKAHGLRVHMDGARFANAAAATGAAPAELTWRSGVEILSFGFTKNGAMAAEAVIVFAEDLVKNLAERRKRGGHLWSKGRFIAAQVEALLENGLWLDLAARANATAGRLAAGLESRGLRLAFPVEANEVFVWLPPSADDALRAAGAAFYAWSSESIAPERSGRVGDRLARLICSFATPDDDIAAFLAVIDRERVA